MSQPLIRPTAVAAVHASTRSFFVSGPALRKPRIVTSTVHPWKSWQPQTRSFADAASGTRPLEKDGRERVVVLGSGWGGYVLARRLDPKKYRAIIVSPRPYFVFTPLLNDSAVGTLEFRNVLESIRRRNSPISFLQGWADDVNFADKTITVEPCVLDQNVGTALVGGGGSSPNDSDQVVHVPANEFHLGGKAQPGGTGTDRVPTFPMSYDKLVIAVGCYSQTFNTPGVRENALFLKDVNDARRIRRRILDLFELAKLPFVGEETKRYLLHFAIVGGGPTGMEFAASLSDLLEQDVSRIFPDEMQYVRISLYDVAPKVLPMFDATLADYAVKQYTRRNIEIKTSHQVLSLRKGLPNDPLARSNQAALPKHRVYTIETAQEGDVGIGMCVWSTGNMANPFVAKTLDSVRRYPTNSASITAGEVPSPRARQWMVQRDPKTGLILVDDHFRVQLETQTRSSASERPLNGSKSSSTAAITNTSSSDANDNKNNNNNHHHHHHQHDNDDSEATLGEALDLNTAKARAYMSDVFAIGDTTILKSGRLPGTAQVANQQALWLANALNKSHRFSSSSTTSAQTAFETSKGFGFRDLGVMTYLGGSRAVLQGGGSSSSSSSSSSSGGPGGDKGAGRGGRGGQQSRGLKGWVAYLIWRGAYLTMTLSWRNKFLVLVQWAVVRVFGRDVSRF